MTITMEKGKTSPSWRSKLEKEMEPRLVGVPDAWARAMGTGKMLIPTPRLIDDLVKKIPKGKLATVNQLRETLAARYHADVTCPLTTGIFLNISAHAAEEDISAGKKRVTPYWRVLKEGGLLNPKFPGGCAMHASRLKAEGFGVMPARGKDKFVVKDFEKKLCNLR
ncbi:MAG: hypothetical protein U0T56_00345 [Ferruginibacter sp.]